MNTQTQEALKIDLENLIDRFNEGWHEGIEIDASDIMLLSNLRECLEQPAQEPVSLGDFDRMTKAECVDYIDYLRKEIDLLRFKEWQGLSDDEVHNYADHNFAFASEHFEEIFNFYRAIEQTLKEKNNAAS